VVAVTTIGRRSGQERQVALVAIPFRDTLTLIGTNWGRAKTPGWVLNLEDQPLARIEYKGTTCAVVARAVEGAEHAEVMAVAARHYRGYLEYQRRITNRPIRIFSLHPVDG
jgi:deazaflavin-dependent oxidoreductase (nitroreductase family)